MKLNYKFIGWCKSGVHDKVWGSIHLHNHQCLTFWGRRGAKLQTKQWNGSHGDAYEMARKKMKNQKMQKDQQF